VLASTLVLPRELGGPACPDEGCTVSPGPDGGLAIGVLPCLSVRCDEETVVVVVTDDLEGGYGSVTVQVAGHSDSDRCGVHYMILGWVE
jgi:hypothetical protein